MKPLFCLLPGIKNDNLSDETRFRRLDRPFLGQFANKFKAINLGNFGSFQDEVGQVENDFTEFRQFHILACQRLRLKTLS